MKKIKRKLIIGIIIIVSIILFAGRLSSELNRMNNNIKKENTIKENIENYN